MYLFHQIPHCFDLKRDGGLSVTEVTNLFKELGLGADLSDTQKKKMSKLEKCLILKDFYRNWMFQQQGVCKLQSGDVPLKTMRRIFRDSDKRAQTKHKSFSDYDKCQWLYKYAEKILHQKEIFCKLPNTDLSLRSMRRRFHELNPQETDFSDVEQCKWLRRYMKRSGRKRKLSLTSLEELQLFAHEPSTKKITELPLQEELDWPPPTFEEVFTTPEPELLAPSLEEELKAELRAPSLEEELKELEGLETFELSEEFTPFPGDIYWEDYLGEGEG